MDWMCGESDGLKWGNERSPDKNTNTIETIGVGVFALDTTILFDDQNEIKRICAIQSESIIARWVQ